jgi:hypothetical protein
VGYERDDARSRRLKTTDELHPWPKVRTLRWTSLKRRDKRARLPNDTGPVARPVRGPRVPLSGSKARLPEAAMLHVDCSDCLACSAETCDQTPPRLVREGNCVDLSSIAVLTRSGRSARSTLSIVGLLVKRSSFTQILKLKRRLKVKNVGTSVNISGQIRETVEIHKSSDFNVSLVVALQQTRTALLATNFHWDHNLRLDRPCDDRPWLIAQKAKPANGNRSRPQSRPGAARRVGAQRSRRPLCNLDLHLSLNRMLSH